MGGNHSNVIYDKIDIPCCITQSYSMLPKALQLSSNMSFPSSATGSSQTPVEIWPAERPSATWLAKRGGVESQKMKEKTRGTLGKLLLGVWPYYLFTFLLPVWHLPTRPAASCSSVCPISDFLSFRTMQWSRTASTHTVRRLILMPVLHHSQYSHTFKNTRIHRDTHKCTRIHSDTHKYTRNHSDTHIHSLRENQAALCLNKRRWHTKHCGLSSVSVIQ